MTLPAAFFSRPTCGSGAAKPCAPAASRDARPPRPRGASAAPAGSLRNLRSRFVNSEDPGFLFPSPQQAKPPSPSGAADPSGEARRRALELRREGLSIHDIRERLAAEGLPLSVGTVQTVLSRAGIPKLARRRPDQVPAALSAPAANRRSLDLSPRKFRTAFGGLYLFAADLACMNLGGVTERLPGSAMIPADCALRALLALKLQGIGRKDHVMPEILDQGPALFVGLNAMPKRAALTEHSCRVNPRGLAAAMDARHREAAALDAGIGGGSSFDLGFHTIPYHGDEALIEKHYVSKRSRRQKGILAFLVRSAETRGFVRADAAVSKATRNDRIPRSAEAWKQRTGSLPAELVFDSRLTTYADLGRLSAMGIDFITLRRRSAKLLAAEPPENWQRITLSDIARRFRAPRVLERTVKLGGCPDPIRQIAVREPGYNRPTLLITNQIKTTARELIDRYARRMIIENTIADAVDFYHMDALSSIEITDSDIIVTCGRRAYNPHPISAGIFETAERLGGRTLRLRRI